MAKVSLHPISNFHVFGDYTVRPCTHLSVRPPLDQPRTCIEHAPRNFHNLHCTIQIYMRCIALQSSIQIQFTAFNSDDLRCRNRRAKSSYLEWHCDKVSWGEGVLYTALSSTTSLTMYLVVHLTHLSLRQLLSCDFNANPISSPLWHPRPMLLQALQQ